MVPKFRAWDKENDRMIYPSTEGVCFELDDDGINILDVSGDYPKDHTFPAIDSVLMQSTGLKDKNGVEIFEGDVLTSNVQPCKMVNPIKDGYGVVRFENGMFKLGSISLVTFISKMEVIGNIYENPELLEQADES